MNIQVSQILETLKTQWENIPKHYMIVICLAGTVFAFLNCFMGYRLRKVWGCVLGVIAGAGGGGVAGYYFLHDKVMAAVCGGAGALILGLMAWLLYKFGMFFMSTALVYGMVLFLFQDPGKTQHILGLAAGVVVGTMALGYEKQVVIAVTSICGGIEGIHLLMAATGTEAGKGELILGVVLAIIGLIVQAAPFMKGQDLEAKLFQLPSGKKKKVVKKKVKVTRTVSDRHRGSRNAPGKTWKHDKDEMDETDEIDEEEEDYEYDFPSSAQEDLDRTQEYEVGKKQYEADRQKRQAPYLAPGIGIDLDDLNRELSQEIKKIYEDDSQA